MNFETKLVINMLGCGINDLNKLKEIVNLLEKETEYTLRDALLEITDIYGNYEIDFNRLTFSVLYLYSEALKEHLASFFDDYTEHYIKNFIYKMNVNIYVNYLDSGYTGVFSKYKISDIKSRNDVINFIKEYIDEDCKYVPKEVTKLLHLKT